MSDYRIKISSVPVVDKGISAFKVDTTVEYPSTGLNRGLVQQFTTELVRVEEEAIKSALLALGWTPPESGRRFIAMHSTENGFETAKDAEDWIARRADAVNWRVESCTMTK